MVKHKQRLKPAPADVLHPLKKRFSGQRLTTPDGEWWELRFIFQPGLLQSAEFDLNIAVVLTRNDDPQQGQYIAYLQLVADTECLQLRWLLGSESRIEAVLDGFQTIYPLSEFVDELQNTITAYPVEIDIPGCRREPVTSRSAVG
ncbi:MAG: hypothetical protein OQK12_09945 [Motiliproteus sp.]|nr:hypothetical protein [Motiliproteus sp.]MCW9051307.1 hypothetical protein [Motiliproteus sp.]